MERSEHKTDYNDKYQNYSRAPKEKQISNEEEIRIKF